MFVPFSRIITMLMSAVLCFWLATWALTSRHTAIAVFVVVVFIAYLVGNIVLWQRMRRRN